MDVSVIIRVLACCLVLAYFVLTSLQSRFRYNRAKTGLLILLLIIISIVVVAVFLIPDRSLSRFSVWAILFWILSAILLFCIIFAMSSQEVLFVVLMVLNLYVNNVAIAKVIVNVSGYRFADCYRGAIATICVLIMYIPLYWILFFGYYKKAVEMRIDKELWKHIWIMPALTYAIFYVKVVNDYWQAPIASGTVDVVFIILWTFSTYVFFIVALQMLLQTYKGVIAEEEMKLAASQLRMQEGQYRRLLDNIESTARVRHDWRHHLLTMNGFVENGDTKALEDYIKSMLPAYAAEKEKTVCHNHVVDVILLHYMAIACEQGVVMDIRADIPAEMGIADMDLCIIFGNLVENAVEACKSCDEGDRIINVVADNKGQQLIIMIKNTYKGAVIKKQDVFFSTKRGGVGIGISSVKRVVETYNGVMKVKYDGQFFTVNLLLNGKKG